MTDLSIIEVVVPTQPEIIEVLTPAVLGSFIPDWGAGIAIPAVNKLNEHVSLVNWGITPDSTDTQITAALMSAIGDANSGDLRSLEIPAATWDITPDLAAYPILDLLTIRGMGKGSIIRTSDNGKFFTIGTEDTLVDSGTLQAASSFSATLRAGAPNSLMADPLAFYVANSAYIVTKTGKGLGQLRDIAAYNPVTKVITLSSTRDWAVIPDSAATPAAPDPAYVPGTGWGPSTYEVRRHDGIRAPNVDILDMFLLGNVDAPPTNPADFAIDVLSATTLDVRVYCNRIAAAIRLGAQALPVTRANIAMTGLTQSGADSDYNVLLQNCGSITLRNILSASVASTNGAMMGLKPLAGRFLDTIHISPNILQIFSQVYSGDDDDRVVNPDGKPIGVEVNDTYGHVNNIYSGLGTTIDHTRVGGIKYTNEPFGAGKSRNHWWTGQRVTSDDGPAFIWDRQSGTNAYAINVLANRFLARGANEICVWEKGDGSNHCQFHGNAIQDLSSTVVKPAGCRTDADGWSYEDNAFGTAGDSTGMTAAYLITNPDLAVINIGSYFCPDLAHGVIEPAAYTTPIAPERRINDVKGNQEIVLPADLAPVSNTTSRDVTGIAFPVVAHGRYRFDFEIPFQSDSATTGIGFSLDGPNDCDRCVGTWRVPTVASGGGADTILHQNAPGVISNSNPTTGSVNADMKASGTVIVVVGPTAGTMQLKYRASSNTGNVTVRMGTVGKMHRICG